MTLPANYCDTLTVRQLLEYLSQFHGQTPVVFADPSDELRPIEVCEAFSRDDFSPDGSGNLKITSGPTEDASDLVVVVGHAFYLHRCESCGEILEKDELDQGGLCGYCLEGAA